MRGASLGHEYERERLSKKIFNAHSWIVKKRASSHFQSIGSSEVSADESSFDPKQFVVPGWSGDSIKSKAGHKLEKTLHLIISDAKTQFYSASFNKSLQKHVFNEFLKYAHEKSLDFSGIDTYQDLVFNMKSEKAKFHKDLKDFEFNFFKRVAIVYLLKTRFLSFLYESLEINIDNTALKNPNASFTKVFRKGSSSELNTIAFHVNHYSWFRPRIDLISGDLDIIEVFKETSLTEVYKIFKIQDLFTTEDNVFSHSLSHDSFGSFLINILTQIPEWINEEEKKQQNLKNILGNQAGNVLKTLFCGDNLESISLSHWLAQSKINLNQKKYIICPDFCDAKTSSSQYIKICLELFFLTLLSKIALRSSKNPIKVICDTYKEKELKNFDRHVQASFFEALAIDKKKSLYDRVVLNLTKFPKKNPHHFLMSQIYHRAEHIKEGGYLFVFSSQKLFLPSMSEKIEDLLVNFKVECSFTFEQLKGRGELSPYLYIISKRSQRETNRNALPSQLLGMGDKESRNQKHPCLSFRMSGKLEQFRMFKVLTSSLKLFLQSKSIDTTTIFQKELQGNLVLEFYQDAILDGRLINTSSRDTNKITHPSFTSNLLKSCYPIQHYFQIDPIDKVEENTNSKYSSQLLGIKFTPEESYQWIMILDYRNKNVPKLEFIPSAHYQAKVNEYGKALCSYFGINPKIKDLNINLFRYFYKTNLGKQILGLALNEGLKKIKSRLNSLLVPKFFEEITYLPESLEKSLYLFRKSTKELCTIPGNELAEEFAQFQKMLIPLCQKYPWHTLGLLINFNHSLENAIEESLNNTHCFENQGIIQKLIQAPSESIWPDNNEVYIEFNINGPSDINKELVSTSKDKVKIDGKTLHVLLLESHDSENIAKIYSTENIVKFLEFIMSKANSYPIAQVLQHTKVPSSSIIDKVIKEHDIQADSLLETKKYVSQLTTSIINTQLSRSNLH